MAFCFAHCFFWRGRLRQTVKRVYSSWSGAATPTQNTQYITKFCLFHFFAPKVNASDVDAPTVLVTSSRRLAQSAKVLTIKGERF
jgi:hypothetical protein